ncbi:JAB domain-containing protein [Vibrio gangliei]|uniref:JAB domain-containing protein n=1 Tax=Vibrio gangliei TaxID=2077090 RepID=UPI000D01C9EC|nr:JAB domain-containing protein [Vibrio gangliei]
MSTDLKLHINDQLLEVNEELVLYLTEQIYSKKLRDKSIKLTSPTKTKQFIQKQGFTDKGYKALILDNQHHVLCIHEIEVSEADVHSMDMRPLVEKLLTENGNAVILLSCQPNTDCASVSTDTDLKLANHIRNKLNLIDCRVLDCIIASSDDIHSLAERGLFSVH